MAATKYFRVKLKGELSLDQAQAALPPGPISLLRVDTGKGETTVYYAGPEQPAAHKKGEPAAEEVDLDTVTKLPG